MTQHPSQYPGQPARLPREADAQYYAQWAVRRIGIALALGIIAPAILYLTAAFTSGPTDQEEDALLVGLVITATLCPVVAIASLCFARAPR